MFKTQKCENGQNTVMWKRSNPKMWKQWQPKKMKSQYTKYVKTVKKKFSCQIIFFLIIQNTKMVTLLKRKNVKLVKTQKFKQSKRKNV